MLLESFSEYSKKNVCFTDSLVDKKYKFKFESTYIKVYCSDKDSLLLIDSNEHHNYHISLKKLLKEEKGGYKIYTVDEILTNPFINNNNQYLESIFTFDDKDYKVSYKKCMYFINKIMNISLELDHYPIIEFDSYRKVKIKLFTHDTNSVTNNDEVLSNRIKEIWVSINKIV